MSIDITQDKMPEELKTKLENVSTFARRFAEYRAKGSNLADSAIKAGSKASTRASLTRVGYNTEQMDGIKEYILWLEHKRAKAAVIDDIELIDKAREIYTECMNNSNYSGANKALETLCKIAGAFGNEKETNTTKFNKDQEKEKNRNNVGAFKEDQQEDETKEEKILRLQKLLRDRTKIVT